MWVSLANDFDDCESSTSRGVVSPNSCRGAVVVGWVVDAVSSLDEVDLDRSVVSCFGECSVDVPSVSSVMSVFVWCIRWSLPVVWLAVLEVTEVSADVVVVEGVCPALAAGEDCCVEAVVSAVEGDSC